MHSHTVPVLLILHHPLRHQHLQSTIPTHFASWLKCLLVCSFQSTTTTSHPARVYSTHGPICLEAGCTSELCFPCGSSLSFSKVKAQLFMGQSHTLLPDNLHLKVLKAWGTHLQWGHTSCSPSYSPAWLLGLRDSLHTPPSEQSSAPPCWAEGIDQVLNG